MKTVSQFMAFTNICMINKCVNINNNQYIKNIIIRDTQLPSLYLNKNIIFSGNNSDHLYSVEHIYPKSLLRKKDHFDMHNLIRTNHHINNMRSNYRYTDICDENMQNNKWISLEYSNYLNKNNKLFIPNEESKGFIARTIMYMAYKHDYNPYSIISPKNLLKWCIENPPDKKEIYHNKLAQKHQHTNNVFIENYYCSMYVDYIKKKF